MTYAILKIEKCPGKCEKGKMMYGVQMPEGHVKPLGSVPCNTCKGLGEIRSEIPFTDFAQTPEFETAVNDALAKFSREFNGNEGDGH